jgi:hypothetical protein
MGLEVKLFDSVLIGKQSEESKAKLLSILNNFDSWQMAGKSNEPVFIGDSSLVRVRKGCLHHQKCRHFPGPCTRTPGCRTSGTCCSRRGE